MKRKYGILICTTLIVLVLDQLTKQMTIDRFQLGESISVIEGFFNFTYIRNTGAAFGIFAQADPAFRIPFFVAVPIIALGAIWQIFKRLPATDIRLSTALSLVIGGAAGNLIDRVRFGYVIDFLDFHWKYQAHFPAFNIADSAICVGVSVLMIDLLFQKSELTEADVNAPTTL